MSDFSTYYDANPVAAWDKNKWTLYDPHIDLRFRQIAMFSPLVTWATLESLGAGNAPVFVTGREMLQPHVNQNSIGLRQRYLDAMYTDTRERRIVSSGHYGSKVQFEKYDPLINMWRNGGSSGFINGILNQVLANSVVWTHEKIARDAVIRNTNIKTYAGGATTAAGMAATSDYKFDIKQLRDVALRLSARSYFALQTWGDYLNPVPGNNDKLVVTTPGVIYDLYDQMESEWMQDLRDLKDQRILNGGAIRYNGWTFIESWDAALWNAGAITRQVLVTSPITAGDGAPDPTTTAIDDVFYTGQSSSSLKHYVQCSDLGTSQFSVGDFVTLHVGRTTEFGVTDGADYLDGRSMRLEVYSVDEVNERLVFRTPVMADYQDGFTCSSLSGSAATPTTGYAYITKGAHINPAFMFGARGGNFFAIRQPVQLHTPVPVDDLETVQRISWDEFGSMNKWNNDLHELHFVRSSFANRGAVGIG